MGKQSKTKQNRKKHNDGSYYLDLDCESAFDFRCKLADMQLQMIHKNQLNELMRLPSSFFSSFYSLLGHILAGARYYEFWEEIVNCLKTVTSGEENIQALKYWNNHNKKEICENPRIYCFNILHKFPDVATPMKVKIFKEEISRHGFKSDRIWYLEGIPHHLAICGNIAGGGSLHTAGTLHLIDAGKGRGYNHELWLARLRTDGIYATSRLGKIGNLKPSEIKSMQSYINNYSGIPISGKMELLQGDEASRICKLLGMTIEGQYAWIGK